jgi:hypothetical protein
MKQLIRKETGRFKMSWKSKFKTLRGNASSRGIKFTLTLEQYIELALAAGLVSPAQIGRTRGSFQMSRFGDKGGYECGNCRFLLQAENIAEKHINGGTAGAAIKKTGQTKENCEGMRRVSEKATARQTGRTKENHEPTARQALKLSKAFLTTDPKGNTFRGINLGEFCKKHNLSPSEMSRVCSGVISSHKGWKGCYIRKEDV